jgi:hypothetical protein
VKIPRFCEAQRNVQPAPTSPPLAGERSRRFAAGEGGFAFPNRLAKLRAAWVVLLLLLPLPASAAPQASDADILAAAEQAFSEGVALRDDEAKARPVFSRAAVGYDELWRRGHHSPDLVLNRAHAHRLAGNLAAEIAALHEGLAAMRWSRSLQVALEEARAAVAYPAAGDLAAQCRPAPPGGIGTRFSPTDAWVAAGLLWLFACGGLARFAMTRAPGWLVFATLWVAGLALLGTLWLFDRHRHERENELPLLVVARDATLRKGNADAYPARLDAKLPRGVEVRKLAERGGWVQVQIAGGAVGWLPGTAVMAVDR